MLKSSQTFIFIRCGGLYSESCITLIEKNKGEGGGDSQGVGSAIVIDPDVGSVDIAM
jgi:hypothetical protein